MHTTRRNSRKGIIDYLITMLFFMILIFMVIFSMYNNKKLTLENSNINYQLSAYRSKYVTNINKINGLEAINKLMLEDIEELQQENSSLKNEIALEREDIFQNVKMWGGSFKSWTNYKKLGKSTKNYKLCQSASVDENGLLVKDSAYLVAMGSGWGGSLGSTYQIILDTGTTFKVMICDEKADKDTDASNIYTSSDKSIIEFYVDESKLNISVKRSGTVSSLNKFKGNIIGVIRLS